MFLDTYQHTRSVLEILVGPGKIACDVGQENLETHVHVAEQWDLQILFVVLNPTCCKKMTGSSKIGIFVLPNPIHLSQHEVCICVVWKILFGCVCRGFAAPATCIQ